MDADIVTYTKRKIEELEEVKECSIFYSEHEDILTMPLEEFFSTSLYSKSISREFLMRLHKTPMTRLLYVFDFLDIRNIREALPVGVDRDTYDAFLSFVNKYLSTLRLSVDMKMDDDQRKYFDLVVRKREIEAQSVISSFDVWLNIIEDLIFSSMPDGAREFLTKKYAEVLFYLTESIMEICHNRRLSDEEIRIQIGEILKERGMRIFDLRKIDWEEIELDKRSRERR